MEAKKRLEAVISHLVCFFPLLSFFPSFLLSFFPSFKNNFFLKKIKTEATREQQQLFFPRQNHSWPNLKLLYFPEVKASLRRLGK